MTKPDLMAELAEVVAKIDAYRDMDFCLARKNAYTDAASAAAEFLRTHRSELEAVVRDKQRLDFIERKAEEGWCPGIINDDSGHWAWSTSGVQPVPEGDDPQTMATTFFVDADEWKPSLREAIDAVMEEDMRNSAREGL